VSATLCIGLRFRPGSDPEQWARTLRGLLEWEPALTPATVQRRGEPAAADDEPWSDELWAELARRCATLQSWSWGLENRAGSGTSLDVGIGQHQGETLIGMDRPQGDLAQRFVELLDAVRGGAEPAMGFLYDCAAHDHAEFVFEGLHRLTGVPPLLYLDARALAHVGGRSGLAQAPCRRIETTGGGLLLVVTDPWQSTAADRRRAAEVARLLGISAGSAVSFLDPP